MGKPDSDTVNELRPEYNLKNLLIRKLGSERTDLGEMVRLEPDVAAAFPTAAAVSETLRFLMRITRKEYLETR